MTRYGVILYFCVAVKLVTAEDVKQRSYEPGIALPSGDAQVLVFNACTICHNLNGLQAYKGYWNRQRWLTMVETMITYGAELDSVETQQVVDYLLEHFGPE